jgi:trans-aconitate methyltransferase
MAGRLAEPVDAIVSTAALHWVTDHDRLWARLARVRLPLNYVRLNVSAIRDRAISP